MCHREQNGCCLNRISVEMSLEKGNRFVALNRRDHGRGPWREQAQVEAPLGKQWEAAAVLKLGNPWRSLGDFYLLAAEQNTSVCKNQ